MRRSVRLAVGISGLVLLVLAAPALAGWLRLRLAARSLRIEAQEQLADRNYPAAARTLERLVREQPDSAEAVGALLLLGKARAATGDLPGAIEAWDELVRRFPEHDLASKARFLIADTLARQGKLREAALRTAERARHFTGDAYRASIAALYLEIADEAYVGTPRGKKGDPLDPARRERHFDRALAMYTRAERVGVAPERRAEVSYRIADCYRQLGRLEAAERAYRRYLERFPDDTLRNRARLELGLVLLDLGRSAEAREQLEQLVQTAGNDEVVPLALRALGRSWKPLEGADPARVDRAARYWRTLLERFPDHEQAPEVAFDLARALEAVGRTDEAVQQYLALEKRYPDHPRAPEARWRAGLCLRRAGRFDEARTVWARFLSQYPLHERFVEVQRAIERLAFDRAERLYAEQRYEQAEAAWRAFVEAQPASELAPQAALRVGESLLRRKAYDAAREALSACASRYRDSPVAPKAQWLLVETLEHTGALREQITALRTLIERWPASPEAARARQRLARLEETELELRSEQVCHAGESFTVRAITRNVEALELRAYPIDLLAYFRKKHTLQGVESLALDVAAPARRWRVETPDYEPYRRFDQRLPLPLEGKGGWVVMAEEALYRATVLAIRSDLSIICKQAPRQLLVFARDERTGRPWPGVRVLVSDGRAIVAQGVSGDDGVFTTTFDRPRGALRVFAHAGHDVAYSDVEPASASASTGYGTKGLVYTDRPLYRPGDRVRMRAIVRTASAGSYQPTGDKPVELLLRAPNGTIFWRRTLRTSRFGTVAAETWLPEAAPLGRWSVVCRFAGLEFPAPIHVEAYVKPELEVRLRPDRDDHVAGEPVQLTVEARAFAGGPAAHATMHYVVWRRDYRFDPERYRRFAWWFGRSRKGAGERSAPPADLVAEGTARTDAQGRATIRFETDTEAGDSVYTVLAEVQGPSGRASTGSRNVHVTRSAYFAVCTTDRRVYRPGDRVRLELFTVRADHTGVARRGELLWQRRDDGQWITTSREPVTTGDDGRATIELEAPAPGSWRLRFEGRDRAGTLVAASVDLEVAGERKQAAHEAKLVFERAVYRRGDRARALVRSPVAPVWALLTFEADRVIGHRVIELRRTSTTIELPMQDRFSPNVFVRIAIPGSHQLFEAGDEIAVVKFLQLHVDASAERVAPGGELTLRFKATDQAGRPVQAELGLAIVDEAIFSLRPDPTPRLAPWFYDQRRSLAVRTRSSYAWSYRGERRERPPALLAELERRQWELEQARRRAEQQRRFGQRLVRSREAGPPPAAAPSGKAQAEEAEALEGAFDRAAGGFGRLRAVERKARARPSPRNAAAPRLRRRFADTAAWAPAIVTAADGTATWRGRLPDDVTRWRITVRGVSVETLLGEARASVRTHAPLAIRLAAPVRLTEGDRFGLGLIVHNATGKTARVRYELEAAGLEPARHAGAVRLAHDATARLRVPERVARPGTLRVRATVEGAGASDAVQRDLAAEAWGSPWQWGSAGTLQADRARFAFTLPEDVVPGTARLELRLAPSVSSALAGIVTSVLARPGGCVQEQADRLLVAAYGLRVQRAVAAADEAALRARRAEVERGVAQLLATQNPDGGWGWWPQRASEPAMTAFALEALEVARRSGVFVDPRALERARRAAERLERAGAPLAVRAALLHALALGGQRLDPQRLAGLLRRREQLSLVGTCLLAEACLDAKREELAAPLLGRIESAAKRNEDGSVFWPETTSRSPWSGSTVEASARAVALLVRTAPEHALLEPAIAWLRARSPMDLVRPSRAAAAVALAFARFVEARGPERIDAEIVVRLDGHEIGRTRVRGRVRQRLALLVVTDPRRLRPGRHRIEIERSGSGALAWAVRLEATERADEIAPAGRGLRIERKITRALEPAHSARGADETLRPGYSVLEPKARPDWRRQQALAKAALGERVLVHLALRLERRLDYLVVEDRLPAGLEPEREGARGPFDRYEARPGGARFFLAHLEPGTHVLHYVARAVTPGRFRALPARAWGMYEPGVHARTAGARFSVLEGQAPARVETPDEIAARARKAAEHRSWREVHEAVGRLLPLALRAPVRTEMLALEVRAALELGETKAAIAAYEALDDLDPGAARTLRRERSVGMGLGAAYLETGAFALARQLLLEQVLAQFETDLEVAEVYRKLGRELPAQRYLLGLVRRYPDREAVIATWYRTARRYYDLERPSDDRGPRHFRPPVRERMVEEAYEALREFIAFFPESSWCDDAQRTAARAMEAIEQWALAAQEYDRLVRRYPDSPHVDDALWGAVRARYEAGQYDAALEAGRRLLAWRRKAKSGAVQRSRHRDEVRLLFARIYHSRGAIAKAVEYYRQVAKRFDDARASLAFFTEPRLELDDVVMLAPSEDTLPLRARNIDALAFEIYPVDLLLLLATHPDLGDVRGIDLTGIRPERRFEVRLGDNRYRWRTERVKLGLDRPGAFLVVCKGEQGIEASCLVVRTPLEVRTQRVDGRLRVYVIEREGRRPVAKAHVSISDGRRIRARGRTDARGVFEAPAFGTPASVVVEHDGQWGLWRAGMGE